MSVERWCVNGSLHSEARMVHEVFHRLGTLTLSHMIVDKDLPVVYLI